ncbi:MAG TPA: NAD(P)H-binding protein [Bacteroidales bacterium]|nr:NAD(P)H-binding protein [Bacteroidales bacterium]
MYKVAILGGTGKTGKFVVDELVKQGYPVRMLVRNPQKAVNIDPLVEVVTGNARNYATIQRLVTGCHAVISTLGPAKGEPPINSVAVSHLIKVMKNLKIKRYIEIAGWGLQAAEDKRGLKTRLAGWLIRKMVPVKAKARQNVYEMLKASNLDWTIVRCPTIEMTLSRRKLFVELADAPGNKVSAADLAEFLVTQLKDETYYKKCPFVAS